MSRPLVLYTHPDCALHEMGAGHPERPARMPAVADALAAAGLTDLMDCRQAPLAEREALERAHPRSYVDGLFARAPREGVEILDPDTLMMPHTLPAALRAAGAGVAAVDAVLGGETDRAFCAVRPPGHHAERSTAMGFCFFGSIAIAALHALDVHGLRRVAICDFDVHHGNGTEDIVDGDSRVLFCSTFQHPFYPGKYLPDVPGQRVNCPLPAGADGERFRQAVEQEWLPAMDSFRPQLVLVSAGFDAHRADPIGGMRLEEADFRWVTERLVEVAGRHSGGRVVSMLEGGYDLDALGRSVVAHVKALMV